VTTAHLPGDEPVSVAKPRTLAAAGSEEFTTATTFQIVRLLRLDRGVTVSSAVDP
jgi:hypothetical protein